MPVCPEGKARQGKVGKGKKATSSKVPHVPVNCIKCFVALEMAEKEVFELLAVDGLVTEVLQVRTQVFFKCTLPYKLHIPHLSHVCNRRQWRMMALTFARAWHQIHQSVLGKCLPSFRCLRRLKFEMRASQRSSWTRFWKLFNCHRLRWGLLISRDHIHSTHEQFFQTRAMPKACCTATLSEFWN